MRNMSFSLTERQVRDGTKTVTRRLGWWFIKPGDEVMACIRCLGLRKGEHIEKIRPIRILSTTNCELWRITLEDCAREGFPELAPEQFTQMFCHEMNCRPDSWVNRIEFEYI